MASWMAVMSPVQPVKARDLVEAHAVELPHHPVRHVPNNVPSLRPKELQ